MKLSWRAAAVVAALWSVMILAPANVLASESLGVGGEGSVLSGPVGGAVQGAEEESVRLSSPEALAEDARSRSEFQGYRRAAAVALAKRVFGIENPHWVAPQDQG